ncbi:MAG TPA: methyltransferase domain-containing protein [Pirellulaceae bacterium]
MIHPQCPLCGSTRLTKLFDVQRHELLACDDCELLSIGPYPSDAERVYETVADYQYDALEIMSAEAHFRSSQLAYERIYPWIRGYFATARTALDVGCGTGYLLHQLREFPELLREGIELNRGRAAFARQASGCDIHENPLQQLPTTRSYDVITLMAVFSHVPDFASFYPAARQLMSDRGRLILYVGEFSRQVKRRAVFDWEVPDHLHFMGLKTAEALAGKFGFRVVEHRREPLEDLLFAVNTWRAPGRSRSRNMLKRVIAGTPGALRLLKTLYKSRHGGTVFNSLIVYERA